MFPATLPFRLLNYAKTIKTIANMIDAKLLRPITHIYYTESDQLVYIRDKIVLDILLHNNNATTTLVGRRTEKLGTSNASEYMNQLIPTRATCGLPGYQVSANHNSMYITIANKNVAI